MEPVSRRADKCRAAGARILLRHLSRLPNHLFHAKRAGTGTDRTKKLLDLPFDENRKSGVAMTSIYLVRTGNIFRVKLRSDSTSDFARCIDALKSYIGVPLRSYEPAGREWMVDADADAELKSWLTYCHTKIGADVIWLKDGEHRQRHTHPPREHRPKPMDAYVTLHLLPTAPAAVIKASYKALAVLNHPDKGGDTATMQRINDAFRMLATA